MKEVGVRSGVLVVVVGRGCRAGQGGLNLSQPPESSLPAESRGRGEATTGLT